MKSIIVKRVDVTHSVLSVAKIIAVNIIDCNYPLDVLLCLSGRLSKKVISDYNPVAVEEVKYEDVVLDGVYDYVPIVNIEELKDISNNIWLNMRSGMMCELDNFDNVESIYRLTEKVFTKQSFCLLTNLVCQFPDDWYDILLSCIRYKNNRITCIFERALAGGIILHRDYRKRSYTSKTSVVDVYFCTGRTDIYIQDRVVSVYSNKSLHTDKYDCIEYKLLNK